MKTQLYSSTIFSLRNIMSSPPPAKKIGGRQTKLYTSDQVRYITAKYDNFHEMTDFSKKYDQLFEIHCKSSMSAINRLTTKTWRCYTQKKKEEVRLHYSIGGNYCKTARAFDIIKSTVQGRLFHYQIK